MYTVHFDDEAISFLNKLEKPIAKRIWNKVLSTKENPFHYFERLESRPDYKLRVGDYRVVAEIDETSKLIRVLFVGHRKNVYDK